jgi:hypothetical protein
MKYELRKLSFGETLGQAFNLYVDNFVALFMFSLASSIPMIILTHTVILNDRGTAGLNRTLSGLLLIVLYLVVNTLCTALTIELISKKYLKHHESIGQYIGHVLPFIFPILGLAILQAIIIGLGFLAFFVPGVYFALGLSVAGQVLIVERKTVMESISRSFFITRGKKLEIAGFWLILVAVNFVARKTLDLVYTLIARMDAVIQTKLILAYTLAHLVDILITPIGACIFILIYFNLRIEKEGFDLEHLVDQFETGSPLTGTAPMGNDQ